MCDIGKPTEIIDVEQLSLPALLRWEKAPPFYQFATVEVPVSCRTRPSSL